MNKKDDAGIKPIDWVQLWTDLSEQGTDIWRIWLEKNSGRDPAEIPFDPFNLRETIQAYNERLLEDPKRLSRAQSQFWADWLEMSRNLARRAKGETADDVIQPERGDRRFKSDAWTNSLLFDSIKQAYLLVARWLIDTLDETSLGLDEKQRSKLKFFTKQYVDALSPSNFPLTNPDVMRETLITGGENLRRGMANLARDLRAGRHLPNIRMTDVEAFTLGQNIATTKGEVVFKNRLLELIQYTPLAAKNYKTPLLIVPPWINKYYILDLRPDNSLVRWALEQGHPVFMISWVNPTRDTGEIAFEDYATEGLLEALQQTLAITKAPSANLVGYCIGGTLLAMTLAYLAKVGGGEKINTATFLTTLLDFENAGDLSLFIDENQIELLEQQMHEEGVLDGEILKTTFNMLRANDLIWSFVINNYLMGREPFPFDLLSWNSDSTNLPAAMHSYYLRKMYLENELIIPDALTINGVPLDLRAITTPAYFLSAREDHIAPWHNTYRGYALIGSKQKKFTLAASGHIAGVVNPPAAKKYNFWTKSAKAKPAATTENWLKTATEQAGSWWPDWQHWVTGGHAPTAKPIQPKAHAKLGTAPGMYVREKV